MSFAIRATGLSKSFRTYSRYAAGLKAMLLHPRSAFHWGQAETLTAVSDVSFEIGRGETFGIVGRNGAGKSTILGLMSGILRPSSGTLEVNGRVCPLLELGVGFAPDLTGRENIFLNGVLLGLRRHEVEERIEEIIAFSGLGHAIDHILKTYSSGMQIRLGFSIAVHSDPEVLLVDEVLAVGDAEFQEQCLSRIAELRSQGVTIVFVSHDLQTLSAICDRAALIDHGRLLSCGEPAEVIARYQREIGAPVDAVGATVRTLGRGELRAPAGPH